MRYKIVIALLIILAHSLLAEKFELKDGTVVYGSVYADTLHQPNKDGITILTQDDRIYLHHYPSHGTYAPPVGYAAKNPYGVPNCVPTRISFIHFENKTLARLHNAYSKVNSPEAKSISKAIVSAYHKKGPEWPREVPSKEKTETYQRIVDNHLGLLLKHQSKIKRNASMKKIAWGKDLFEYRYIKK
tara:strand:- start:2810 stop:3370 length:561 start_codon:yes stop_codon:yes gene_type:complete